PVVLHFDVIIAFAEDVFELFGLPGGFIESVREQERRRNSGQASRQRNQSFAMSRQQFFVDTRFVVVALCERERRELGEILIPGKIFGEQDYVIRAFLSRGIAAIGVLASGDVGFHADDGFDAG